MNDADPDLKDVLVRVAAIQNYYIEESRENELPSDINQPTTSGDAAIHVAAMYLKPEDLSVLLAHGADVKLVGEFGATPLHCAAVRKRLDNFVVLLQHGADPDLRMHRGIKPVEMVLDDEALKRAFVLAVETHRQAALRRDLPAHDATTRKA